MNEPKDKIIALSGLLQASILVTDLAQNGQCDDDAFNHLLESLFVFNPPSTLDVYGGDIAHIKLGLETLNLFYQSRQKPEFGDIAKYMLGLIALQKQGSKQHELMSVIHSRLQHIDNNKMLFSNNDHHLSSKLSSVYQDTLSTLKFRIMVTGNMQYLNTTTISDKIRSLLLAGFRAAMLWRHVGGKKWQLIFSRREIERLSAELLKDIT